MSRICSDEKLDELYEDLKRDYRKQITDPSEDVLATWRWEDEKDAFIRKLRKIQKARQAKAVQEDFPEVKLTSEVRVKK